MVTFIANYCIHKIQIGNSLYIKELFDINKFRLEQGLVTYKNGKISKDFYKQVVFISTTLNEIQWTEKFIEKYTPLLFVEHQESMKNLAMAFVFFSEKKYDDVLYSLSRVEFSDIVDKVLVKSLMARTHYEMKEFELLLYHIDSTKHFLSKKKKLGNFLSEVNSKFFNYLHSIVTANEKKERAMLIKLEEKIRKDEKVYNKIWLLEKIEELK